MSTKAITLSELSTLHQTYLNNKATILSADIKKRETETVWFEMNADLKNTLTKILGDSKVDGIRFYFTAYKDVVENGFPENVKDLSKMSVAFVATEKVEGGASTDSTSIMPLNHADLNP